MITYHSTRGSNSTLSFKDVVLSGVADDKGLYLPNGTTLENLSNLTQEDLSYEDFVKTIFIALDKNSANYLDDLSIYSGFENSPEPVLREIENNKYVMELFHGPTKSFKDYALQPLGAIADRNNIDIVVLHPHNKVSEYQRRQMTEVIQDNVLNIAIDGSYDDCQQIAKTLLQENVFNRRVVSLNSINWLRVMGQTAYYVWLTKQFTNPINISIPSGNFGNAYSAWFGRSKGLPINEIYCASNMNDVLTRFIASGSLEPKETMPTVAPSMDIQIPSSLERLIYDLEGDTSSFYNQLQNEKVATLSEDATKKLQSIFSSKSFDDEMILKEIKDFNKNYDWIVDPHTATAVSEKVTFASNLPVVGIATASPEKFSNVISSVISSFSVKNSENTEDYIVCRSDSSTVENTIKEYF